MENNDSSGVQETPVGRELVNYYDTSGRYVPNRDPGSYESVRFGYPKFWGPVNGQVDEEASGLLRLNGIITDLVPDGGIIDDTKRFTYDKNDVQGVIMFDIGDEVVVEAKKVPGMPFEYKAVKVTKVGGITMQSIKQERLSPPPDDADEDQDSILHPPELCNSGQIVAYSPPVPPILPERYQAGNHAPPQREIWDFGPPTSYPPPLTADRWAWERQPPVFGAPVPPSDLLYRDRQQPNYSAQTYPWYPYHAPYSAPIPPPTGYWGFESTVGYPPPLPTYPLPPVLVPPPPPVLKPTPPPVLEPPPPPPALDELPLSDVEKKEVVKSKAPPPPIISVPSSQYGRRSRPPRRRNGYGGRRTRTLSRSSRSSSSSRSRSPHYRDYRRKSLIPYRYRYCSASSKSSSETSTSSDRQKSMTKSPPPQTRAKVERVSLTVEPKSHTWSPSPTEIVPKQKENGRVFSSIIISRPLPKAIIIKPVSSRLFAEKAPEKCADPAPETTTETIPLRLPRPVASVETSMSVYFPEEIQSGKPITGKASKGNIGEQKVAKKSSRVENSEKMETRKAAKPTIAEVKNEELKKAFLVAAHSKPPVWRIQRRREKTADLKQSLEIGLKAFVRRNKLWKKSSAVSSREAAEQEITRITSDAQKRYKLLEPGVRSYYKNPGSGKVSEFLPRIQVPPYDSQLDKLKEEIHQGRMAEDEAMYKEKKDDAGLLQLYFMDDRRQRRLAEILLARIRLLEIHYTMNGHQKHLEKLQDEFTIGYKRNDLELNLRRKRIEEERREPQEGDRIRHLELLYEQWLESEATERMKK